MYYRRYEQKKIKFTYERLKRETRTITDNHILSIKLGVENS